MAIPNQDLGPVRTVSRWALGAALTLAGIGHLTTLRSEFQAQVPDWFPVDADLTVVVSGIVEIALGAALVTMPKRKVVVGLLTAAFFVVIFPGNIAQWVEGKDGFGLNTDAQRLARLFFQPVLVLWALWSTGAGGTLARWVRDRR
jgi:uncharacterized membrane protein